MLRDLLFNIKASDVTGKAFQSVKRSLSNLDGVARKVSDRFESAGKSLARMGGYASAGSGAAFLAFRDSLELYDIQAKAEARVAQAIRNTGGAAGFTAQELHAAASEMQGLSNFGDEQILNDVTAQLLNFGNISGDEFMRAQQAALDMSEAMGVDLSSSAENLGKALKLPADELSGLEEMGIFFTESQKDMIATLAETGRTAEAQRMILDKLESTYAGSAEAGLAGMGAMQQLNMAFGDMKEVVGGIIADILPPFIKIMRRGIDIFQSMPAPIQKIAVVLGVLVVAAAPVLLALSGIAFAMSAVSAPVLAVIGVIAGLAAAFFLLWPAIKATIGFFADMGAKIRDVTIAAISSLSGAVKDGFGRIFDFMKGALSAFLEFWQSVWIGAIDLVGDAIGAIGGWLVDKFGGIVESVKGFLTAYVDFWRSSLASAVGFVADAIGAVKGWLVDKFGGIIDFVGDKINFVAEKFGWLYDVVVGNSYVPDMIDGISGEFSRLPGEMSDKAKNETEAVAGYFEGMGKDIAGVMRGMVESGDFSMQKLHDVLRSRGQAAVTDLLDNVFNRLGDGMQGAFDTLAGNIGGIFDNSGAKSGGLLSGLGGAFMSALSGGAMSAAGGADFMVGGRGGVDRNFMGMNLSRGERVQVTPRGGAQNDQRPIVVNIQTPNPQAFERSKAQVGAQLSRAVSQGSRVL